MSARKRARVQEEPVLGAAGEAKLEESIPLSGGDVWPPGMWEQQSQGLFCDAVVTAEGQEFAVHRSVLALGSPYFEALYTSSLSSSGVLTQVSAATFEVVLRWLYTGSCEVTAPQLVPVIEAADVLQVSPLRDAAEAAIVDRLTPSNCVDAWGLARLFNLPSLLAAAQEHCLRSFERLQTEKMLGELSLEQMADVLRADTLAVPDEMAAFRGLVSWSNAQKVAPAEAAIAGLVQNIRFERMDEEMRSLAADEPIMQSLPLMKILAKSAIGSRPPRGFTIPHGVQLSVDIDQLQGWSLVYDEPYSHKTTLGDLQRLPKSAKYVFVGARNPQGAISIGAFGACSVVLQPTKPNETTEDNGVFWYLHDGTSFGFSPTAQIQQCDADMLDVRGGERLSWLLCGHGGYRAGVLKGLQRDSEWRKLLYCHD